MGLNFGIILTCYSGDQVFAGACISSIRHFCGDVPICVFADDAKGRVKTKRWEDTYGVSVVRKNDVNDRLLADKSFYGGFTKMVAFWESPFETFLHIDADMVLWGNPMENLPAGGADFVHNEPHEEITDRIQREQYFDSELIGKHFPPFNWKGNPYFNSGIYWAKRGIFDRDEYLEALKIRALHPGIFLLPWEQGILNYLVYSGKSNRALNVGTCHLQTLVPSVTQQVDERRRELESTFILKDGHPLVSGLQTSIHWAGAKPWPWSTAVYQEAMHYWIRRSLAETKHPARLLGNYGIHLEGIRTNVIPKYWQKTKDRLQIRTKLRHFLIAPFRL